MIARTAGRLLRRLSADPSATSAVEFAIMLPIMLVLFFGTAEFGEAITIDRKVGHVASALGDLVAQSKSLSETDMQNILDASASIITPYDSDKLSIIVSQVKIDDKGKATVDWSQARNATPLAKNASVTLPTGVIKPSSYVIMTEAHYNYQPDLGYVLTGSLDLKGKFYLRPRLSSEVEYP
jgi:Flp pilus assembly protein TadG